MSEKGQNSIDHGDQPPAGDVSNREEDRKEGDLNQSGANQDGQTIDPDQPILDGEQPANPEPQVPQIDPDLIETQKKIKEGLSVISKTYDNASYAYVNLNLEGKELKKLHDLLKDYPHLKYVNLAVNEIENIDCVFGIPYLLQLNAQQNAITSLESFTNNGLPFLQFLNLQNNKITKLPAIQLPRLRKLNLSENLIESCAEFQGHTSLEILDLRKNKLKNCEGIKDMLSLQELDLSENEITNFQALTNLTSLKTLSLKANKLEKLRLPWPKLPNIHFFDVGDNGLTTFKEVKKLVYFPSVRAVNFAGNPIEDVSDLRKEILLTFMHFTKVNDDDVTPEDIEDVNNEIEERKRLAEEERLRKLEEEEEERKRKEEEAEQERLRKEEEDREREEAERIKAEEERERLAQELAAKEQEKVDDPAENQENKEEPAQGDQAQEEAPVENKVEGGESGGQGGEGGNAEEGGEAAQDGGENEGDGDVDQ